MELPARHKQSIRLTELLPSHPPQFPRGCLEGRLADGQGAPSVVPAAKLNPMAARQVCPARV